MGPLNLLGFDINLLWSNKVELDKPVAVNPQELLKSREGAYQMQKMQQIFFLMKNIKNTQHTVHALHTTAKTSPNNLDNGRKRKIRALSLPKAKFHAVLGSSAVELELESQQPCFPRDTI